MKIENQNNKGQYGRDHRCSEEAPEPPAESERLERKSTGRINRATKQSNFLKKHSKIETLRFTIRIIITQGNKQEVKEAIE